MLNFTKMALLNAKNNVALYNLLTFSVKRTSVKKKAVEGVQSYSNTQSNYRIRNITEVDIPKIAEIRKSLNLHDCLSSLYSFHKLDPEAIFVAEDDKGQIIGTHSMICFSKGLYLTGLTYVDRNYRNNSLAVEMIQQGTVRHRLKNRLCVGFTFKGWVDKLENLLGFKVEIGFVFKRHISTENVDTDLLSDNLPENVVIHPLEDSHLNLVYDYDLQIARHERRTFLDLSFNESNSNTLIALKKGRCVGFGSIKLSLPGAKRVGPLYADDPKIAEALLKSLLKTCQKGTGAVMVVPSLNLEAQKLMNKLNIPLSDKLYYFYEKGFPQADVIKAYAHFDVNGSSI